VVCRLNADIDLAIGLTQFAGIGRNVRHQRQLADLRNGVGAKVAHAIAYRVLGVW
jgi:hypothetical protein